MSSVGEATESPGGVVLGVDGSGTAVLLAVPHPAARTVSTTSTASVDRIVTRRPAS